VIPILIAAARVLEQRVRRSPSVTRPLRRAMARLAKISPNARAFVRLRLMRLV